MPQTLLDDLRMNAAAQELGSMAVPKIMETNSWKVHDPSYEVSEFMRQALRLLRFAIFPAANQY